jgi:hypothetical protein
VRADAKVLLIEVSKVFINLRGEDTAVAEHSEGLMEAAQPGVEVDKTQALIQRIILGEILVA